MELFVMNRHEVADTDKLENQQENTEEQHINRLLKKIERNKKIRSKQREKEAKKKLAKQKTIESREVKRKIKSTIVPVPENNVDGFIDETEAVDAEKKIKIEDVVPKKKLKLKPESLEGFTILGPNNIQTKRNIKRVLPNWLTKPTVISTNLQDLNTKVSDIKQLDKDIRKVLKENGIKYFFPVQATLIPWLLMANKHADVIFPRDVCVSAPTGSGKTLAFVLPVVQALKNYAMKQIRALVILPTQDLALQVYKNFKMYAKNTNIEVCLVTGNNSFAVEQSQLIQRSKGFGIVSKVDVLVCTAGRLVDHLKLTQGFNLRHLEFLIIDEADRVLENIQNDWLYHLENHIRQEDKESGKILNLFALQKPKPPQKLLFSATLSQDPEKLKKLSLFQPKLFTSVSDEQIEQNVPENGPETFIGKYTTPKELTEKYIVTTLDLKPLCLYKFIVNENLTRTIVFTYSAESVHRLAILLKSLSKNLLKIETISSQLQGNSRNQLSEKFANNSINILVCTDALARGIDLPNVQCVISYSAPKYLKTYIHRAGRTARAGEEGLAVTLLNKQQVSKFKEMMAEAGKTNVQEVTMPEEDLEPLGEDYKQSLQELKVIVEKEEQQDLEKAILAKGNKRLKRKRSKSSNFV